MVQVPPVLLEAVGCRQRRGVVAQMVLAELPCRVPEIEEELRECWGSRPQVRRAPRELRGNHARAQRVHAGEEGVAARCAALPRYVIHEHRALVGDAVDAGRLADHEAAMIHARLHPADVVAHDEQDVGLRLRKRVLDRHRAEGERHQCGEDRSPWCIHVCPPWVHGRCSAPADRAPPALRLAPRRSSSALSLVWWRRCGWRGRVARLAPPRPAEEEPEVRGCPRQRYAAGTQCAKRLPGRGVQRSEAGELETDRTGQTSHDALELVEARCVEPAVDRDDVPPARTRRGESQGHGEPQSKNGTAGETMARLTSAQERSSIYYARGLACTDRSHDMSRAPSKYRESRATGARRDQAHG